MNFFQTESEPASLVQILSPDSSVSPDVLAHQVQILPPRSVEWNRVELDITNLPPGLAGLRILHLSDFHLRSRWPAVLDRVLARIQENPPDLALLTGDFVDNKRNYRPAMPQVRRLVAGLTARIGCFAIHGNHDSYKIGAELRDTGVIFLDGRRRRIDTPRGAIELIGLPGKRRAELTRGFLDSLPLPQAGVPRIVMSHYPDHLKRTGGLGADLFLAGHTHGGQICLPGGRPIIWHDALPRKLCRGAHRVQNTWLVVSRGIGFTGLPLRTFSVPEVIEIVCRPARSSRDSPPPA